MMRQARGTAICERLLGRSIFAIRRALWRLGLWMPVGTCKFLVACTLGVATVGLLAFRDQYALDGWYRSLPRSPYFEKEDDLFVRRFTDTSAPDAERYNGLFNYFVAAFLEFRDASGARIYYPGSKGNKGHSIEGLEGFARTAPLVAAWLASGRPAVVIDPRHPNRSVDLRQLLRQGVLTGTNPESPDYWGDVADYDQRIVEAADVALLLWLTQKELWSQFSAAERQQIAAWLRQVETRAVHKNNWLLFRIQVIETLRALGAEADAEVSARAYREFKALYLGSGWFTDPPKGVDYYNAWAISYSLFWIDQMNPKFDHQFIRDVLRQSASLVLHLISPDGVPIMGRSQCYRFAIPAPVVIQSRLDPTSVDPGLARHALDAVWVHFVRNGGLAQGRAEQGYYRRDLRLLDQYSGPGSCQWSLRSLVPAFLEPPKSAFWQAPLKPLPVELSDYRIDLPALGWIVEGNRTSERIVIRIPANGDRKHTPKAHSLDRRVVEFLFAHPFRPRNDQAKYKNGAYSSALH